MGKPGIVNPNDRAVGMVEPGGLQMAVIADLPYDGGGAWINFILGENALTGEPKPGPHVPAGSLVVVIPPDAAATMRQLMRQAMAASVGINKPD